ncbi:hypothetical protein EK904_013676 [Melospiza melodia maxima]|nr:hypothetical protein EK904_013676 [Melospiza melodia maxima]
MGIPQGDWKQQQPEKTFCVLQVPKRRKEKVQMKEISAGTEYQYGDINIQMTSHDLCLVEHFAQYVHRLCNRLCIRVNER